MKNLLNISEEEKSRILEMHQPNGYKNTVENQTINEGLDMSKMKDFTGLTSKQLNDCLLYTSPSPRDRQKSRMPSSA